VQSGLRSFAGDRLSAYDGCTCAREKGPVSSIPFGPPPSALRFAWRRLVLTTLTASAVGLLVCAALTPAEAQEAAELPTLHTNEEYVSDVTRRSSLDIENVMAVFEYVLGQLPQRVRVFPTENYYYFYFYHGGVKYAGNLRFDVEQRDKGFVEFIYFKDTTVWFEDDRDYYATLGNDDGVVVKKLADLVYEVSFADKRVAFELNDLSAVTPPQGALSKDETFLGPVSDESGIRFFLTFDESLKLFHYVLDETAAAGDEWLDIHDLDHISIGRRTSFALFQDPHLDRKLLVGVYDRNIALNNYLDGPFDQLPDNFLKGDVLRRAILSARPDPDASMDRLGIAPDGETREKIAPYIEYGRIEDLAPLEKCAAETDAPGVYACLDKLFEE